MALRNVTQLSSNEADIQLAISSINASQIQGNRPAATVYNVAETTLRRRRDYQPNSKKLTQREEEVIVRHILELDTRGFSPTYNAARDIANLLLSKRSGCSVGRD